MPSVKDVVFLITFGGCARTGDVPRLGEGSRKGAPFDRKLVIGAPMKECGQSGRTKTSSELDAEAAVVAAAAVAVETLAPPAAVVDGAGRAATGITDFLDRVLRVFVGRGLHDREAAAGALREVRTLSPSTLAVSIVLTVPAGDGQRSSAESNDALWASADAVDADAAETLENDCEAVGWQLCSMLVRRLRLIERPTRALACAALVASAVWAS